MDHLGREMCLRRKCAFIAGCRSTTQINMWAQDRIWISLRNHSTMWREKYEYKNNETHMRKHNSPAWAQMMIFRWNLLPTTNWTQKTHQIQQNLRKPYTTYLLGSSIIYHLTFDCLPFPIERLDELDFFKGRGAGQKNRHRDPYTHNSKLQKNI